jgi:hypothetical protein
VKKLCFCTGTLSYIHTAFFQKRFIHQTIRVNCCYLKKNLKPSHTSQQILAKKLQLTIMLLYIGLHISLVSDFRCHEGHCSNDTVQEMIIFSDGSQLCVNKKIHELTHLLRCARHSGVNDSAEIFLKFASLHSSVNHSAVHFTVVSMTRRRHWLRCDKNRRLQSRFSRRILIHIQKGFNPCIRGLGGVVWW